MAAGAALRRVLRGPLARGTRLLIVVRPARLDDRGALAALEFATWDGWASPAPRPTAPADPFRTIRPQDVLVADAESGELVGSVRVAHPTRLRASAHVLEIGGLGVLTAYRRRGVATGLLDAVAGEARRRGVRRLTLRVLAPNAGARALYERAGFVVEGILRGEFHIRGEDVDDVLMARIL